MASKWNHLLPLAVTFTLCVFLPRWLAAAESNTNTNNQTNNATTGTETSTAGQIQGTERFLRENREVGQMVGGDVQGVGNLRGQTDGGSQGTSNIFGSQNSFSSRSQLSNFLNSAMFGSSSRQQRQQLRVPLRIGPNSFPFSSATPPVASGPNLRVQNRLARLPQLKERGSVQVEMEGQVAVLRGAVTSQHERDLVARLVLLEPGIADVRNELQVGPAAPKTSPSPSPKP